MKVSVVVVCEKYNENLEKCLGGLKKQTYKDFEVIVVTNDKGEIRERGEIREIGGRKGGPSEKRNYAVKKSKGEILAFLDDDCVPEKDWLKNGIRYWEDRENKGNKGKIGGVGGPMITPPGSPFMERVSGYLLSSFLVFGSQNYRNKMTKGVRFVEDYPSANFFIRKSDFEKIGGFDQSFWPGEDTKLCLDIINKLGKKIVYDPGTMVYHRRRPVFRKFLEQVARYGRQRGRFARLFPKTSRKIEYFVPSIFVLYLGGVGVVGGLGGVGGVPLIFYIILVFFESIKSFFKEKNILIFIIFAVGVFLTHVVYGINFLKGLALKGHPFQS